MQPDRFPILTGHLSRRTREHCPRTIPWALIAPHEAQAVRNHGQSLQRLAERGGLSPSELYAVLHDRGWEPGEEDLAVDFLLHQIGR